MVKDEAKDRIKELFPQSTFDTFNVESHSQAEYVRHAEEIGRKVIGFLDSQLLALT